MFMKCNLFLAIKVYCKQNTRKRFLIFFVRYSLYFTSIISLGTYYMHESRKLSKERFWNRYFEQKCRRKNSLADFFRVTSKISPIVTLKVNQIIVTRNPACGEMRQGRYTSSRVAQSLQFQDGLLLYRCTCCFVFRSFLLILACLRSTRPPVKLCMPKRHYLLI